MQGNKIERIPVQTHRIVVTKKELHRYGIKADDECLYCGEKDSIEHTFLNCQFVKIFVNSVMNQSIPAVPIPPPGNRGVFAHVVIPGGGAFAILSQPGGWALAYPGATPGHLTHVFSKEAFVKD